MDDFNMEFEYKKVDITLKIINFLAGFFVIMATVVSGIEFITLLIMYLFDVWNIQGIFILALPATQFVMCIGITLILLVLEAIVLDMNFSKLIDKGI